MYYVSQEVAVAFFFLSLSRAWPMGLVAFLFSWGLVGAVAVVLAVGQMLVLGSDVSFSVCKS